MKNEFQKIDQVKTEVYSPEVNGAMWQILATSDSISAVVAAKNENADDICVLLYSAHGEQSEQFIAELLKDTAKLIDFAYDELSWILLNKSL